MFKGVPPPTFVVVWVWFPPLKLTVWVWFDAVDVEPVQDLDASKDILYPPPPAYVLTSAPLLNDLVVIVNAPLELKTSAVPKGSSSLFVIDPVIFIEPLVCECEPFDDVVALCV